LIVGIRRNGFQQGFGLLIYGSHAQRCGRGSLPLGAAQLGEDSAVPSLTVVLASSLLTASASAALSIP